jgi:hypothetical protein
MSGRCSWWEYEGLTPTSRKRTSRHSAPKSFMRASASSRRLPFSTPDETSGIGISRWTRYTRVQGGTSAMIRAVMSTSWLGG